MPGRRWSSFSFLSRIVDKFKNVFRPESLIKSSYGAYFVNFYAESDKEESFVTKLWAAVFLQKKEKERKSKDLLHKILSSNPALITLLPPSVWQTNRDPSRVAQLSSAQRGADHPVMSSVCISVGRRIQEFFRFSNAARVLVSPWRVPIQSVTIQISPQIEDTLR